MGPNLAGRVALVTGASRGLGRAMAVGLARAGAAVALVARSRPDLERVADEIRNAGGRAEAIVADQMRRAEIDASVRIAAEKLGPVDILVNNAGDNQLAPLVSMDPDEWWRLIELDLRGPYLYCRAVLPSMLQRRRGRIINVGSVASKLGVPFGTAYTTAKHGLIGLTRALAAEVAAEGITVNAVCPAWMKTDMTDRTVQQRAELYGISVDEVVARLQKNIPRKAVPTPSDVVPVVVFLASDEAGWITGDAVNVAGGQIMH